MPVRVPQNLRVRSAEGVLEIVWSDDQVARLPFRLLRQNCPCAACVNEFTGERILNPDAVPLDVHPRQVELAGNYGLKIAWSDGHATGIFTWEHLERVSQASG
jgi:DUF971 family protein